MVFVLIFKETHSPGKTKSGVELQKREKHLTNLIQTHDKEYEKRSSEMK